MKNLKPVAALKNKQTEDKAAKIAMVIFEENEEEYQKLMTEFRKLNMVFWEILAFKDRVHWLLHCHKNNLNIVTGKLK